jgi:large subunit ribosomal protein L1
MAKKAELYEELKKLDKKTTLTIRNTIAELEAAIAAVKVDQPLEPEPEAEETTDDEGFTKAGKRSKKAVEEAEAEAERQERKGEATETPVEAKKGPKPITRPLVERRGKKYQEAAKLVDNSKFYTLAEAIELAVKTSPSKFDATVEIHARLGVDPRQADQNIRTTVNLPNGNGKTVRVAVFAPEADAKVAKDAGADIAGDEELLAQLGKGAIDFDVLIATPAYMPKLGKFARILGPKGLMPNPKAGTVTADIKGAVTAAKAGKVEYRVDKQAIVHIGIGKVSFGANKLLVNASAFFDSLKAQKPASIKGAYVKSLTVSTSQGPAIKLENSIN